MATAMGVARGNGLSGRRARRGASRAKASRTLSASPGQGRSAAGPSHQVMAWALRSLMSANARGEEVVADVANGPLHPTLLVASGHGHGPRFEAMVARERQERGVEPDGLPASLEDRTFEVVVEDHPRNPTERLERQGVAGEEGIHAGVEEEPQEEPARVTQHHHEGHQRPPGAPDLKMTEVAPVDLGLLAGKGAKAQVGLGIGARTMA